MFIQQLLFILGISALWRLGGSGRRYCRYIAVPVFFGVYALLTRQWFGVTGAVLIGVTASLPISLFGDDFLDWRNILWYPVLGSLYGAGVGTFAPNYSTFAICVFTFAILYTLLITMADLYRVLFKKDVWFIQEILSGGSLALMVVLL